MKWQKANSDNHTGQTAETGDPGHPLDRVDQRPDRGSEATDGPETADFGQLPDQVDQDPDPLACTEGTGRSEDSHFLDLSQVEPFVKPEIVAEYIGIDTATVVRFAALDILPGHPIRESGKRCHWRFLLSEVRRSMLSKSGKKVRSNVRKKAQSKAKGS